MCEGDGWWSGSSPICQKESMSPFIISFYPLMIIEKSRKCRSYTLIIKLRLLGLDLFRIILIELIIIKCKLLCIIITNIEI